MAKKRKLIENTSKVLKIKKNAKTLDFNDDGEIYYTNGIPDDEPLFIF